MCHRPKNNGSDHYGDGDVPEVDTEPYKRSGRTMTPKDPLPESWRERRDGPGGE